MKRWLFDQLHRRSLIYNQCWEDPSIDQAALNIRPCDRIVTITSAGCNALDYLLRRPRSVDCVDMNPNQTALLELKLVALRRLEYPAFFSMFGLGRIQDHRSIYDRDLRHHLSISSQMIWDRRIDYFAPEGKGLYFHGTSGFFARILNMYADARPSFRADLDEFQRISSVGQQACFYRERIAPRLWTAPIRFLMRRAGVLALLGVPVEQIRQMQLAGVSDLSSIIEDRVERMFTTVPIRQNYFWRVYLNGRYSEDCCPNYLKRENFDQLRSWIDR